MVPGRLVRREPDEPAEQEVELEPLHQLALRADRVERLQQHRPQQHLRRDRDVAPSYVSRVLRLTLLAPDIIEAILDGRRP